MDDFERRRELRRQKREEMRLEAERLSYQRNDDDDEEAARERRRRARQERLRQKEEGDLSGEVTEKSEVNAQNSVAGEESKRSTDDEAALLERLARREERRQKRLQEALERQKEFDPTITDGSLSLPSRREVNNVEENETTGKEEKAETRGGHCEIEETETVTKSYQRNNWRQDGEEQKKEEKDKEEVQEDKTKEVSVEENQIDVTAEKPTDKEGVETKSLATNAEEHKAENDTNVVPEGTPSLTDTVDKEKLRDEDKAEEERKEAEERERLKAEEEKRAAEEKQKAEEEKRAAEERAKAEEEKRAAEERAKAEEEKRAAEERAKAEEEKRAAEERAKAEEEKRAAEERAKAEEEKRAAEERARLEAEKLKEKQKMEEQKIQDKQVKDKKAQEEKPQAVRKQEEEKEVRAEAKREKLPEEKLQPTSRKDQVKDDKDKGKAPKEEMKSVWDQKKGVPEQKTQNGERELTAPKLKPTENAFGRSNLRGTANAEESKPEALKRLEDQRRRRGENDSEELEKLKEKQQEAAAELDELKKRREERRKILEEEEQKKKQEEAERKVREEEEKKRMKEEIERRRAEAAEKRQKIPEDGVSEDKKPFKCFSPKGSSLKIYFVILFTIEERTEFLNKSAQKSGMKPTQTTAVVSKIDSRLEQYTSAIEGTKASRPAKPAASDLHVPAEGVRNIKSMWEKGNFSSPSGTGTPNKETAGLKVGVSSRINEWLTKTPESNKSPAPKPSDLKPGDVSGKRNLWEKQSVEKPPSSSKVSAMGKKSEANGLRQLEKEP
ncbi:caldesmon isoform X2 [Pseudopipra pipra]|uniref:caldesmon isoform X2 n=1 Tax=Pseudopipra pipra TaxID=415032 RepID=UPI00313A359F